MVPSTVIPFFRSAAEQKPRPYLAGRNADAVRPFAPPVHDGADAGATAFAFGKAGGGHHDHSHDHSHDHNDGSVGGIVGRSDDDISDLGPSVDDVSLPDGAALSADDPSAHLTHLHARLDDAIAELIVKHDALLARARVEVVDLALQVATHVTGQLVAREAFDLNPVVDDALRQLGDALAIVVRVGPLHHAAVAAHTGGNSRVRVVLDASLGDGDVVVDSDNGTVDARLQGRFEAVGRALRGTLQTTSNGVGS
jgi:hypothetical protein